MPQERGQLIQIVNHTADEIDADGLVQPTVGSVGVVPAERWTWPYEDSAIVTPTIIVRGAFGSSYVHGDQLPRYSVSDVVRVFDAGHAREFYGWGKALQEACNAGRRIILSIGELGLTPSHLEEHALARIHDLPFGVVPLIDNLHLLQDRQTLNRIDTLAARFTSDAPAARPYMGSPLFDQERRAGTIGSVVTAQYCQKHPGMVDLATRLMNDPRGGGWKAIIEIRTKADADWLLRCVEGQVERWLNAGFDLAFSDIEDNLHALVGDGPMKILYESVGIG